MSYITIFFTCEGMQWFTTIALVVLNYIMVILLAPVVMRSLIKMYHRKNGITRPVFYTFGGLMLFFFTWGSIWGHNLAHMTPGDIPPCTLSGTVNRLAMIFCLCLTCWGVATMALAVKTKVYAPTKNDELLDIIIYDHKLKR